MTKGKRLKAADEAISEMFGCSYCLGGSEDIAKAVLAVADATREKLDIDENLIQKIIDAIWRDFHAYSTSECNINCGNSCYDDDEESEKMRQAIRSASFNAASVVLKHCEELDKHG